MNIYHPAPGAATADDRLVDPFGRQITYLRMSVTDRCNLRCTYCMAEEMTFLPRQQILTLEEMLTFAEACLQLGEPYAAQDALIPHEYSVSGDDAAQLHLLYARSLANGYSYDEMIRRFESARTAGYTDADWHLHVARAQEQFGAYDQAIAGIQVALMEITDPALKAELNAVGRRCAAWKQMRAGRNDLPAVVVAGVKVGTRGAEAGFKVGDEILSFNVDGTEHIGGEVMTEAGLRNAWTRYLTTSDEHMNEAVVIVRRGGETTELRLKRGALDFELFTLKAQ